MNILVTGATGFLGGHVVKLLSQHQHQVTALIRSPGKIQFPILPNVKIGIGDLTNVDLLQRYLENMDAIVHTAADTTMGIVLRAEQFETNVTGTANLIEASQRSGTKRFVHVSTANVFVPGTETTAGTESRRVPLSKSLLPYIQTKLQAEQLILTKVKDENFPALILNPTFMIGPEDYKPSSGQLILAILKRRFQFYPKGGKNFVDVRDVAETICKALSLGSFGENYLVAGQNVSYQDLHKNISEKMGFKKGGSPLPDLLGQGVGVVGSAIEHLTRKPMTLNHLTIKMTSECHYYSSNKAAAVLGFVARPFHQTLTETVNWLTHEQLEH